MIDGDRVKLIDLGAMRKIGDQGGLIFGTEGFIAPEASRRSDRRLRPLCGRTHAGDPADGLPLQVPNRHRRGDAQDDDAPAASSPATRTRCPAPTTSRSSQTVRLDLPLPSARLPREPRRALPERRRNAVADVRPAARGDGAEGGAEAGGEPGVLRRRARSTRADVEGAAAPLARLLPALRFDADDPAAEPHPRLVAASSIRAAALQNCSRSSPIARRNRRKPSCGLADAMIAAGQPDAAIVLTDRILGDNEFEWRAHWYAGKALLRWPTRRPATIIARAVKGAGDPVALAKQAQGRFDRVYFEMPGELAPRLGMAMAAEVAGDFKTALALLRARRGDRSGARLRRVRPRALPARSSTTRRAAANALAAMPASHSMYRESRLALACALYRRRPGPRRRMFLFKASDTLAALENRERGAASGRGRAHDPRRSSSSKAAKSRPTPASACIGVPLTPQALRLEAARRYAARRASGRIGGGKGALDRPESRDPPADACLTNK